MKRFLIVLLMLALLLTACDTVGGTSSVSESLDASYVSSMPDETSNETSDDTSFDNSGTDLDFKAWGFDLEAFEESYSYSLEYTDKMRERFDSYFNLTTMKGIECYVWIEDGQLVFGLMSGTNRLKTEEEINALLPATLGDIRLILNHYTFSQRYDTIILFDRAPELSKYSRELEYLLGIGKYCIEYTVSYNGNERRVCWNESAWELYNMLDDLRSKTNGDKISVSRTDNYISISFHASGSEYLGSGLTFYGNYGIYDNDYCSYYPAIYSSTIFAYLFPEGTYDRVMEIIDHSEYPEEYMEISETKCSIHYGINTQNEKNFEFTGEKANAVYDLINERMENAPEPTEEQLKAHYGIKAEDNTTPAEQPLFITFYSADGFPYYIIYPDGFVSWAPSIAISMQYYAVVPEDTFDEIVKLSGIKMD